MIKYKAKYSSKRDSLGAPSLRNSREEICDPKHLTPKKIRPENMTIE
jgi:hypothetical protein